MNNTEIPENVDTKPYTSSWKPTSKMEKLLTVICIIVFLIVVILSILAIVFFTRKPETCITQNCVRASKVVLEHINPLVNPCDDFYQFACGNFLENTNLDEGNSKSTYDIARENALDKVKTIITEPVLPFDVPALLLAKRFYKSCINDTARDKQDTLVLKGMLRKIGGWPILDGNYWNKDEFDWKETTYQLRRNGFDFEQLISIGVVKDENDSTKRIIELSQPYFFSFEDDQKDEQKAYIEYMVEIAVALGADLNRARYEQMEVLRLERQMALITKEQIEDLENRKITQNLMSLQELRFEYREVPWYEFLNTILQPAASIERDAVIAVRHPLYLKKLQNIFQYVTQRTLSNFICWQVVKESAVFLSSELFDKTVRFYQHLSNSNEPVSHQKVCESVAIGSFGHIIQAAYIKRYFPYETKEVTEMVRSIKSEFKDIVTDLDWMDEYTKRNAVVKIVSGVEQIGYAKEYNDINKVNRLYDGLQIYEYDYFSSYLNLKIFKVNLEFQRLNKLDEDYEWLEQSYGWYPSVSFSTDSNKLSVSAGILQGQCYEKGRPTYLNYGCLGTEISHYIYHILFEGKQHCSIEEKYYGWLSSNTLLNYDNKLKCIFNQYSEYYVPELHEHVTEILLSYNEINTSNLEKRNKP